MGLEIRVYQSRRADGSIKTYGTQPDVLMAGETEEHFEYDIPDEDLTGVPPRLRVQVAKLFAMDKHAGRCALSVDKRTIEAGTGEIATVTVKTNLQVGEIVLRCEAIDRVTGEIAQTATQTVTIADGVGTAALKSSTPALLRVTPDDRTAYPEAGVGSILVEATEAA